MATTTLSLERSTDYIAQGLAQTIRDQLKKKLTAQLDGLVEEIVKEAVQNLVTSVTAFRDVADWGLTLQVKVNNKDVK